MMDLIFVTYYFLFPIFICILFKRLNLSFFKISLFSFSIVMLFVSSYIGILPLYFGLDSYRYNIGVQDRNIIFKILIFSSWSILAITLGYAFFINLLKKNKKEISFKFQMRSLNYLEKFFVFILFGFSLMVLWIYLSQVSEIALFVAIRDGVAKAKIARSDMTNAFSGKYHWYALFMYGVLNLVTFISFANWLIDKKKKSFLFFFLAFIFASFTATMTTQKAPFVWLLLGLFLTYIIVKYDRKIPILESIKVLIPILFIVSFSYIVFMGSKDIGSALYSIFSRLFSGQISPAYFYLEFFPSHHEYLWGSSFPNPGGLLPFTPYRLTVELMNWRFPHLAQMGIVGSSPTVFWGEMYANFGLLGVIIPPFFIGGWLFLLDFFLIRLENSPLKVGFFVWLVLHYKNLASTGLSKYIVDFSLIMLFLMLLMLVVLANKGLKYYSNIKNNDLGTDKGQILK